MNEKVQTHEAVHSTAQDCVADQERPVRSMRIRSSIKAGAAALNVNAVSLNAAALNVSALNVAALARVVCD